MLRHTKKTFFREGNTLNKGYQESHSTQIIRNILNGVPDIGVISEYENLHSGSFAKILDIAQKEQESYYSIERRKIFYQCVVSVFGNIFGFFTCCVICFTCIKMLMEGEKRMMAIFSISSFASIFLVSVIQFFHSSSSKISTKHFSDKKIIKNKYKKKIRR